MSLFSRLGEGFSRACGPALNWQVLGAAYGALSRQGLKPILINCQSIAVGVLVANMLHYTVAPIISRQSELASNLLKLTCAILGITAGSYVGNNLASKLRDPFPRESRDIKWKLLSIPILSVAMVYFKTSSLGGIPFGSPVFFFKG